MLLAMTVLPMRLLRYARNDNFPNKIDTFPLVARHDKIYANSKV